MQLRRLQHLCNRLSRVLAENKTHVSTHTYGTISYMAPELLSLGKFARAADVYSFAILSEYHLRVGCQLNQHHALDLRGVEAKRWSCCAHRPGAIRRGFHEMQRHSVHLPSVSSSIRAGQCGAGTAPRRSLSAARRRPCRFSLQSLTLRPTALAVWELYSGEALYEGMTVGQVLYAVVYDAKRPPILDGCPPEYAALMRDCWKSEPTERCAPSWLKPYTNSSHPVQRAPICGRGPFAEGRRCICMLLVCASVAQAAAAAAAWVYTSRK